MHISKKKQEKRHDSVPTKLMWILAILVIVIFSCCYLYTDLPFSTAAGLRVWNCIKERKLSLFYWSSYPGVPNSALPDGSAGGEYDFLIYLVFAVYGLPLWIFEQISGYSFIQFFAARVYMKGILWLFSGLSAYLIYKIALECEAKKENAIWASFLFLTSGIFVATEVTIGGYDIISVTFSLLGIYGFLKKNEKIFIAAFAIGVATKLFAIWLFIPLLLLQEKKFGKFLKRV